jgi:hypothetical protein
MGTGGPMIERTPEIEAAMNALFALVESKRPEAAESAGGYKYVTRDSLRGDSELLEAYDTMKLMVKNQLRSQLEPIVIVDP